MKRAPLIAALAFLALGSQARAGEESSEWPTGPKPRFELKVSQAEFSELLSAARSGIRRFGGDADFRVNLSEEGGEIFARIAITNPLLAEAWSYWMLEHMADLLSRSDLDRLTAESRLGLKSAATLRDKLASMRANPVFDELNLSGTIEQHHTKLVLAHGGSKLALVGGNATQAQAFLGKKVFARGQCRKEGELELKSVREMKENTLEVFVLSQCPYAKKAEYSLIRHLREKKGLAGGPSIELRYIFYTKKDNPGDFTCLHGEPELQENLVQMSIRDLFPTVFHDYILERSARESSWDEIAVRVGLSEENIETIRARVGAGRANLIAAEHAYAVDSYGITDGSPTFVWEGRIVRDIQSVAPFAGLEFSGPSCSATN